MKSPAHDSRMSFDMTSPIMNSSPLSINNNNIKQKNSNNTTASIRSRSSKRLTAVGLIFL